MRLVLGALTAFGAFAFATAAPSSHYVVHEKRLAPQRSWVKRAKLESSVILPVKIGLKQNNLHRAEEYIMEVADPKSPKYGQHWTAEKVASTFAASESTVAAVRDWLVSSEISPERLSVSGGKNWVTFDASIGEAERILATEFFVYEHENGDLTTGCESYSVPAHVREHIDFITPTVHFNRRIKRRPVQEPRANCLLPRDVVPPPTNDPRDLSQCDGNATITPDCLKTLYGVPLGNLSVEAPNSIGILILDGWPLQSDLDMFMNYTTGVVGERPIPISIDGGNASTFLQPAIGPLLEVNLDVEAAMSLVYPLNVTLYSVGDYILGGTTNLFLDALDANFCDYDGGDDPDLDPTYPDIYDQPGAYNHTRECGTQSNSITNVISSSYLLNEYAYTSHYKTRQCFEFMKLGLQGVTMVSASGDGGVAGFSSCDRSDSTLNKFEISFPSSCPYVTSVGATMVKPNVSVTASEPEMAVFDGDQYKSTGGFSDVFPLPSYQNATVQAWWQDNPPTFSPSVVYNNSRATRAIPDVALNGLNYINVIDSQFFLNGGTSASAPAFASLVARINQARLNAGKGPVGFINPVLYANPQVFTDITAGDNICGGSGFKAVKGWDPVTGLGTPKFQEMVDLFLTLP